MSRSTHKAIIQVTADDAPPTFDNEDLADAIRDGVFVTISNSTGLDVVVMEVYAAADAEVTYTPAAEVRPKVWVATVSDENDDPGPAVYVSNTEDNLITVIRKQQGIPDDAELLEWLDDHGKVAVWDSYYVETGEE